MAGISDLNGVEFMEKMPDWSYDLESMMGKRGRNFKKSRYSVKDRMEPCLRGLFMEADFITLSLMCITTHVC